VKHRRLRLHLPTEVWLARTFGHPSVQIAVLTAQIAIRSCFLPGDFHDDPADRFIVATALEMGLKLITRDQYILHYGRQGYAAVMAC
jgi:PIN domain nuclease of toxin-antitoxin system